MKINCKNCKHWKNHQRLLNYHDSDGFCLNRRLSFSTANGRFAGVIDTQNLRDQSYVSGNPSYDFESADERGFNIKFSRYLLATNEDFGCNFFESK